MPRNTWSGPTARTLAIRALLWGTARACWRRGKSAPPSLFLSRTCWGGNPSPELRDYYSQALLAANRLSEAEPLVWQLFEQNPGRMQQVVELIGQMIDCQQDAEAVALARKLELFQRRRGERRSFVATMQDLVGRHRSSPEMLEFLSELFNSSNRENDYCQ